MNPNATTRYQFKPNPKKPGYVIVYDLLQKDAVIELWQEHAMIVAMMYQNLLKGNVFAANEFMYGHIMGLTYTLMYADKYPKVEIIRGEDGLTTSIKMTEVNGTVRDVKPELNASAHEALKRTELKPPKLND